MSVLNDPASAQVKLTHTHLPAAPVLSAGNKHTHIHNKHTHTHNPVIAQVKLIPTRHPRSLGKHTQTHTTSWCINERIKRSPFWCVERLSTYLCKVQNVFDRRAAWTVGHVTGIRDWKPTATAAFRISYDFIAKCQYNCTRNIICGAKCTCHTFTPVIKHH